MDTIIEEIHRDFTSIVAGNIAEYRVDFADKYIALYYNGARKYGIFNDNNTVLYDNGDIIYLINPVSFIFDKDGIKYVYMYMEEYDGFTFYTSDFINDVKMLDESADISNMRLYKMSEICDMANKIHDAII